MVRTGIVRRVLETDPRLHVVVLSPMATDTRFVNELGHPRVSFESLPPHQPRGIEARLVALMQAAYIDSGITESVRVRRIEAQAKGTIRWIRAKRVLAQMLAPSLVEKSTRYDLIDRRVSHRDAEALFERYQPLMVVTSSPGLILSEVPLLRTAARRRIWSMAIDPSWDNFTNKLLPVRRVDRLVVWNDIMRQQAIDLHGYQPEQIRVAGVPQWDRYFRAQVAVSRAAYCARVGADPNRALLTLTTTPRELYPHHDHVLKVMLQAMSQNRYVKPVQILVRLHPRDDRSHYTGFERTPGLIIEKPFRDTVRAADGMAVDVTAESQQHLADTLHHSDVIINVASTIAVEAAIFDTPVVNISFDGETPSDFARSAQRYYRFTHYTNITRHNAVRVAESPGALIEQINAYLADPQRDAEGRRKVVAEQCEFLDGRSAERVADVVVTDLRQLTEGVASSALSCA